MNSRHTAYVQRIADCSGTHLSNRRKDCMLNVHCERNILLCCGMLLSDLGQTKWSRHGTSKWWSLNMGVEWVLLGKWTVIAHPNFESSIVDLDLLDSECSKRHQILFGSCSCDVSYMQLVLVMVDTWVTDTEKTHWITKYVCFHWHNKLKRQNLPSQCTT